jgi:hypothetical protein
MKALIPAEWMQRQLGGKSRSTVIKAALIGAPLPLCSCGVVPAALGLRRAGASKGATVSFLVATPETGPDSIALSYALLGPFMAIARPVAAISSAIVAGLLVRHEDHFDTSAASVGQSSAQQINKDIKETATKTSCCSTKVVEPAPSCCSSKTDSRPVSAESVTPGVWAKIAQGISFSFGKLLDDIAVWLLIGITVAAVIQTFVPTAWLAEWGQGWTAMLLMAIIGVPMYICASASTPIAAGFLAAGVSPGAVLVFMLAGPATNIGTLGIIRKELGSQSLVAYLTGVIVTALVFGGLTDLLLAQIPMANAVTGIHTMDHSENGFRIVAGLVMLLLIIRARLRR